MGLSKVQVVKKYLGEGCSPVESKEMLAFWKEVPADEREVFAEVAGAELGLTKGDDDKWA